MQQLLTYLASHKPSTHALAGAALTLITAYKTSEPFHHLVNQIGSAHPTLASVVAAGASLFMIYIAGQKKG